MSPTLVPLAFAALAVAGGGVVVYLSIIAERKRRGAMAQVALTLGFSYLDKVPKASLAELGKFHLLQRGRRKMARSLMEGRADDDQVTVLDYQYTTGGGKDSHTRRQTVVIFRGAPTGLPDFTFAPEHFWHRIGSLFGYQDIDFEASEDFSKHYLLRGPDETAIRAAFGAEALGFFAQNPGWTVESCDGSLAVYRSGKRCPPEQIQSFLAEAATVRRALVKSVR